MLHLVLGDVNLLWQMLSISPVWCNNVVWIKLGGVSRWGLLCCLILSLSPLAFFSLGFNDGRLWGLIKSFHLKCYSCKMFFLRIPYIRKTSYDCTVISVICAAKYRRYSRTSAIAFRSLWEWGWFTTLKCLKVMMKHNNNLSSWQHKKRQPALHSTKWKHETSLKCVCQNLTKKRALQKENEHRSHADWTVMSFSSKQARDYKGHRTLRWSVEVWAAFFPPVQFKLLWALSDY